MGGSVLCIAVGTEEALEVLTSMSKDGSIVREEVLSISTVQGSVHLMSGPIYCL